MADMTHEEAMNIARYALSLLVVQAKMASKDRSLIPAHTPSEVAEAIIEIRSSWLRTAEDASAALELLSVAPAPHAPEFTLRQWKVIRQAVANSFWAAGYLLDEYKRGDEDALAAHGIFDDFELHEATQARIAERAEFDAVLNVLDPWLGIGATAVVEEGAK